MAVERFDYHEVAGWPPLAWVATCRPGSVTVDVLHGDRVERRPRWFCEGAWAGPYVAGDFDRTDLVFGSGARLREEGVVFVSSGSTVDRLQSLRFGEGIWVSNSLPCLLAMAEADIDPLYRRYRDDFETIEGGLRFYKDTLETSRGQVRLTYFDNLHWDGSSLTVVGKPDVLRDFGSFSAYTSFLERSIVELARNAAAAERDHPYGLLGTLSKGYDSPAVACLARAAGLRVALTFGQARGGEDDAGFQVGAVLGVAVEAVRRDAWTQVPMAEVPFLAAEAGGEEVHFRGAERLLSGNLLLTGFHGDYVWTTRTRRLGSHLTWKDPTGLSLSEYRLWAGFAHCPVPFMGARQVADIDALTRSPELAPWRLGGSYDRPIPRRVLEEAGVPREAFGMRKRAVNVLIRRRSDLGLAASRKAFVDWLDANRHVWVRRGRVPPRLRARALRPGQRLLSVGLRGLRRLTGRVPRRLRPLWTAARDELLFRHMFPWAIQEAKRRYSVPLESLARSTAFDPRWHPAPSAPPGRPGRRSAESRSGTC